MPRLLCARRFGFLFIPFMVLFCAVKLNAEPIFYTFPFQQPNDSAVVKEIEYIENGGIWLLDTAGNVSYYDGTRYHSLEQFTGMPIAPISKLEYFDDALWFIAGGKLYEYDYKNNTLKKITLPDDADVNDIASDNNQLWLVSDAKTFTFELGSRIFIDRQFSVMNQKRIFITDSHVYFFDDIMLRQWFMDKPPLQINPKLVTAVHRIGTDLWVGTNEGIYLYQDQKESAHLLTNNQITSIASNNEGMWVGTLDGLFLYQPTQNSEFSFELIKDHTGRDRYGFSGQQVYDIEIAENGDIWVVSDIGLNYRSRFSTDVNHFSPHEFQQESVEESITSFVKWNDEFILSYRNKLVGLNNTTLTKTKTATLNITINTMAELDNTLWIGSASGLYAYSAMTFETDAREVPSQLQSRPINKVIADSHSLWLTMDERIVRYWPKSQTVVDYGKDWSGEGKTRLTAVIDLEEEGTLLGSSDGVFTYYDGEFKKNAYHENIGTVKQLHIDNTNRLWILTNRGVYRKDLDVPTALKTIFHNGNDKRTTCISSIDDASILFVGGGIVRVSDNEDSPIIEYASSQFSRLTRSEQFCLFQQGKLTFTSDHGVFSLKAESLGGLFSDLPNSISVSALFVDGQPWRLGPLVMDELVFSSNSALTIDIGVMPVNNKHEFDYRLMNDDVGNWYNTKETRLNFDTLVPGHYELVVKIPMNMQANQELTVLSFYVEEPWYLYIWRLLSFLLLAVASGLLWVYKRKTMKMKAHNRQLRETVYKKVVVIDQQQTQSSSLVICAEDKSNDENRNIIFSSVDRNEIIRIEKDSFFNLIEENAIPTNWQKNVDVEIDNNFHDPDYSPSILAKSLFISERSLQRRFKVEFGHTFKEALIAKRLDHATRMLGQGDRISDVAVACGFNEPSYFTKSFKAKYKCTPSLYKELFIKVKD